MTVRLHTVNRRRQRVGARKAQRRAIRKRWRTLFARMEASRIPFEAVLARVIENVTGTPVEMLRPVHAWVDPVVEAGRP